MGSQGAGLPDPALSLTGGQPCVLRVLWGPQTTWNLTGQACGVNGDRLQGLSLGTPPPPPPGRSSAARSLSLTWLHGAHDSCAALQYRLVDGLLVLRELAIGREGAGDVRSKAVVLSAHVEQAVGTGCCEAGGQMSTPFPLSVGAGLRQEVWLV